jgi:hypothetical protein
MKRKPGHASVEEHPKGSGLYRVRRRVGGRLVTLASGGFNGEEAAEERPPEGHVVYFIANGGMVKIGHSSNTKKRLGQLQGATGASLALLATMPGSRSLEELLHSCFRKYRASGEWFHNCGDVTACIAALRRAEA